MMRFVLIGAVALGMGGAASAQDADGLYYDFAPTSLCIARSETSAERSECIGRATEACINATGYATPVLSGCAFRELENWDAHLNAVYQAQRARSREFDMGGGANAPSLAVGLRDMQRAWIEYRDATCSYEAAQWGGGTGAGPAFAGCLTRLTAEQALYLEFEGMGG
jgi:uncharacterized protein YecT (DUF1311 family)